MTLKQKLDPSRFSEMSPKMAALVGCILGETYTNHPLAKLSITSDGILMGMEVGDIGFNQFIGNVSDFERNWNQLLKVAGLTNEEQKEVSYLKRLSIEDHRV